MGGALLLGSRSDSGDRGGGDVTVGGVSGGKEGRLRGQSGGGLRDGGGNSGTAGGYTGTMGGGEWCRGRVGTGTAHRTGRGPCP